MEHPYQIGVGGALLREKKLLLVRRAAHEEIAPGHWETPGGGVDVGEHPAVAVIREFSEETGIKAVVKAPYFIWHELRDTVEIVAIEFLLEADQETTVVLSEEHDRYTWVTRDELDGFLMTPQMRQAAEQAFQHI